MGDITIENFPYKYKKLSPEENQELIDYMQGVVFSFIRVGPKGYFLLDSYISEAANIYNMPIRSDDIFVVTFPKSGTTWIQELVWLLKNDLNYDTAKSIKLSKRFHFLELSRFLPFSSSLGLTVQIKELAKSVKPLTVTEIKESPSPRLIKSHLPLSLLQPSLLENAKVVYVARDPRDVAVSFFHHNKLTRVMGIEPEFKPYWNYFVKDKVLWSPYFQHVLEAWQRRNHSNLLFLFYEDLLEDLPAGIRRVAKFLDKDLSNNDVADLTEHLSFKNFKYNKSVNMEDYQKSGVFRSDGGFMRKGVKGGWREYFDEEMTAQADKWINDNLRGTDFCYPHTKHISS